MRITIMIAIVFLSCNVLAQQTIFEQSGGTETATYAQTINYYNSLASKCPVINIKTFGKTDAGKPLHLIMVSADKKFDPKKWHEQGKVVLMINNGIHPGEPDGIDASMMLVRDIAIGKVILPENTVMAFIPVYNIGGALNRNSSTRVNQDGPVEYGFRGNAQNLDLNRDFTKCDSYNARTFAEIFHYLNPDIFIDNHVSDGADYQHTMTLITTQYQKLGPVAGPWLRDVFEPSLYKGMKAKNWDLIPYVEFDGADLSKGITMFNESPRYSSGYAALFGTLSFIPETHMLKPYKQRVESTYDLMVVMLQSASVHATALLKTRTDALAEMLNRKEFALSFVPDVNKSSSFTFKGYKTDTVISEATGLKRMSYNRNKPFEAQVKFFNTFYPDDFVEKPKAYIIPVGWHEVIDRLRLNAVQMSAVKKDSMAYLSYYKVENYKSILKPYEKHHFNYDVKVKKVKDSIMLRKGDLIVYTNQPAVRYLIEMLEPTGSNSFFTWNFFDAVLQQKEGYSNYRWEDIAADILKENPELAVRLKDKKASDPAFAKNENAILYYIYENSKWLEKAYMRYPVYRLEFN